jgi:type I restriction enzyme, S subunit
MVNKTWRQLSLGEVATLQRGYDLPHKERKPGTVPIISSSGSIDTHNESRAAGPGVVTGRYGTIGEVFFVSEDFWPLNTTLFVKDFKGNDPLFISFLLRTIDYHSYSGKSGVPGVNRNDLHEIGVSLPPLPEQRAIAATLSDMDSLISSLDRLIAKKRDIKQATMQQLLTGEMRLPGFSGEWKVKKVGEIAEIGMGRTPSRRNQNYWGRGYKWLSIADLKSKHILETKEEITAIAASDMTVIPKGTLVMSFKLTIGKLAFTGCDMYSNEAICSFSKLRADAEYLYYILGQTDFSLYGKQAVKGYTLNTDSLNSVQILYPPLPEQQAIADILTDMDAEITALEQKRDKTRALKQGIMQELLSGKTRLV